MSGKTASNNQFNRILIIDDQKSIHEDFSKILTEDNPIFSVTETLMGLLEDGTSRSDPNKSPFYMDSATQGEEGLNQIKQSIDDGCPYQVAFVDMRMPPGWDGLKTIEEIWGIDKDIQTVICTAYSDYSWEEIIDQLGNSDRLLVLKKPFDKIEVLQLASALCNKWILSHNMNLLVEKQLNQISKQEEHISQASRLAALGKMAGGIAHEINNPLAIINGYMLVMEKIVKNEDVTKIKDLHEHIKAVKATVQRISKIVNNMRKLSRDAANDPPEVVSCKEIVDSILLVCNEKFKHNEVEITLEKIDDEFEVMSNSIQLHQAVLNVVLNAYDAISDSSEKWIKINCDKDDDFIHIYISNSGDKIDESVANKIFNPFFTTKDANKGTGLGLSIARTIVENHKGKLYLNEKSKYTEFVLSLPSHKEK